MKFTKMHGLGNDYIYFNGFEEHISDPNALSVRLSDRNFGVGGDGIVLILPSTVADFRMRMFNADGSEGKMCGNASRCIGKYVYEKGLTDKTELTLETLSGIKHLHLELDEAGKVSSVAVDMGNAAFATDAIPMVWDGKEAVNQPLTVAGCEWHFTGVSVGNPHCVVFCKEPISNLNLPEIGPLFENAPQFPERVNTEFVNIIDSQTLSMRVWERGSGETMACGTGACAVAAAAVKNSICKPNVVITVRLLGGELRITVRENYGILMEGPAAFVFEGTV